MKLALRFAIAVIILVIAFLAIDGYVSVRRIVALYQTDMKQDARAVGDVLGAAVTDAWKGQGQSLAMKLIADANRSQERMRIRWVWLDPAVPQDQVPAIVEAARLRDPAHFDRDGSLYTYVPVQVEVGRLGAIEIAESQSQVDKFARSKIAQQALTIGSVATAATLAILGLGVWLIGRPIRALTAAVRQVGAGELAIKVEPGHRDELGELGQEIDAMAGHLRETKEKLASETSARITALEQLRHADRLATVGQLAAGVAHELGTPLNVVLGRAQMIASSHDASSEAMDCSRIIAQQAERMTRIIRHLLDFARAGRTERGDVDLVQVVSQVLEVLRPMAGKAKALLSFESQGPVVVTGDRGQIQQVLTNLVMNAVQAMPSGGSVKITLDRRQATPPAPLGGNAGSFVCVAVQDNGMGISTENLARIFDPFFTTKDVGEGTGLGLAIVYGIVREHEGWVAVSSALGKGSCFEVYLPEKVGT